MCYLLFFHVHSGSTNLEQPFASSNSNLMRDGDLTSSNDAHPNTPDTNAAGNPTSHFWPISILDMTRQVVRKSYAKISSILREIHNKTGNLFSPGSRVRTSERDKGLDSPHVQDLRLTFTSIDILREGPAFSELLDKLAQVNGARDPELVSTMLAQLSKNPRLLNVCGDWFSNRFSETMAEDDINKAISAFELASQLTPIGHVNYVVYFHNASIARATRFQFSSKVPDIDQAISHMEVTISVTPSRNANLPTLLNYLGHLLLCRFEHTENVMDIESAISSQRRAIHLTPDDHVYDVSTWLNNLGNSFAHRFSYGGDLKDIESAISTHQRAAQLIPDDHAEHSFPFMNLAASFIKRFKSTGNITDIESAISNVRRAIALVPENHPNLPDRFNNLGNAFVCRFQHTGDLTDIENAISNQQRAIQLTQEGDPLVSLYLSNLGGAYIRRFEYTGDLKDIESAISTQQRAIQVMPADHARRPLSLNNLGTSFLCLYERTGASKDIESALSNQQQAIKLTRESSLDLPPRLNNLGNSFLRRFENTRDIADIEEAISAHKRAIQLTRDDCVELPAWLHNLAISYIRRFEYSMDLADIDSAISTQRRVIELIPGDHPSRAAYLNTFGLSWKSRFGYTNNEEDLANAISNYRLSAVQISGYPQERFSAARSWAMLSRQSDQSDKLEPFRVAIDLYSEVAGLEQTISRRHINLVDRSNLTTVATATAIQEGEMDLALAWLEEGRCLVWSQIKQLRTPVEDLRTHNSALADRFLYVARALEMYGSRRVISNPFSEARVTQMVAAQDEAQRHAELAKEWTKILEQIRVMPEFHDFLRPPTASGFFTDLPRDGPVIIFNIHEDRGDAFALISGAHEPLHIPLKDFSWKRAMDLRDKFRAYLNGVRAMREVDRKGRPSPFPGKEITIYEILRDLWIYLVRPILDALAYLVRPRPIS